MDSITNQALALVREMSSGERQQVLRIFEEFIAPADPHWELHPCWPIPAPAVYAALRLMMDRAN